MRLMRLMGLIGHIGHIGLIGHIGHIGLMGLIGLIGLMACSSEHGLPEQPEERETGVVISFSGSEGAEEEVTRGGAGESAGTSETSETRAANSLHEAGINAFTIWGYKNMAYNSETGSYGDLQTDIPGYTVRWIDNSAATTLTNSSGWEYILADLPDQTIKYWDWGATAYRFFGVTGGLTGTHETNETYETYEIALPADVTSTVNMAATPYYSQLWFSTGNYTDYPTRLFGQPVQLMFQKPFTRVRMIIKYTYPREGINLTGLQFKPTDGTNIARKGTVTVIYPLTGTDTKETYSSTPNADPAEGEELTAFTVDYDPEDDSKEYEFPVKDGWYTVFPNMSQGSYTLNVNVNGSGRTAVVPAQYMRWLPGYSYTYVFKINEEGGVEIGWVEYAVTPWTEMEINHTTHNW